MAGCLIFVSLLLGAIGLYFLAVQPVVTGAGVVAAACLFAILARIAQARKQHAALLQAISASVQRSISQEPASSDDSASSESEISEDKTSKDEAGPDAFTNLVQIPWSVLVFRFVRFVIVVILGIAAIGIVVAVVNLLR